MKRVTDERTYINAVRDLDQGISANFMQNIQ